jgi:hypothetical protein
MDANELHDKTGKNLLDQIAADPDVINRPAVDVVPMHVPAPVLSAPGEPAYLVKHTQSTQAMNLLQPDEHAVAKVVHKHKLIPLIVGIVAVVALGGGATAYFVNAQQAVPTPTVAVKATATPTIMPTASPTPAPTPTLEPSPTPVPTVVPAPAEVTAPAVAPTVDHPQAVKVTSKSGLWLRSSASSVNQKNVIGWMPNGASVSVDATGAFWWHGTYAGKTGYFAVNYTK